MIPQDGGLVLVTIWGKIRLASDQDNTVKLKVRDITAGTVTICELDIDTVVNPPVSLLNIQQSATFSEVYALPSGGPRTFDFVWSGDTGSSSGSFSGFVEIKELRGD